MADQMTSNILLSAESVGTRCSDSWIPPTCDSDGSPVSRLDASWDTPVRPLRFLATHSPNDSDTSTFYTAYSVWLASDPSISAFSLLDSHSDLDSVSCSISQQRILPSEQVSPILPAEKEEEQQELSVLSQSDLVLDPLSCRHK